METVGRWTAITVITPVPRWWALWLRFNFWRLERARKQGKVSQTLRDLERLAFIAFAHWGLVEPVHHERGAPAAYLLFQSNFNGAGKQYVEAFARVIATGMRGLWFGAHGVPDPRPVAPFEDHIERVRLPVDHYFCAYPDASTKMVLAALSLREPVARLAAEAEAMDDAAFARAWDELLAEHQDAI